MNVLHTLRRSNCKPQRADGAARPVSERRARCNGRTLHCSSCCDMQHYSGGARY